MDNLILSSATVGIVISLLAYEIGLAAQRKWKLAVLNPLLISIILVIAFLVVFHVDYESYNMSAKYLSYLLTPATVCLAIPLYLQLDLLKKNIVAILVGVFSGVLASLGTVLAMSVVFGLNHKEYVTMLPKSITTAIGMGVSEELGGYVTISVAKKDFNSISRYMSSVVIANVGIMLILLPISIAFIANLGRFINLPVGAEWDVKLLFFLIFFGFCINLPGGCFYSCTYAANRLDKANIK